MINDKKIKWRLIIVGLVIFLILTLMLAVSLGAVKLPFFKLAKLIASKIPLVKGLINNQNDFEIMETIIFKVRLPRVLLAALVGVALATAGTLFQSLLKNPMADPYIIGISSGASLGASLGFILKLNFDLYYLNTIPLLAFIGALLTVFIVYNLAKYNHKISIATLLLAGVAVGSFLSAIVSLLMVFNDDSMHQIVFWTMGSLATSGWKEVQMVWLYIIIAYIIIYFLAKDLNLILLGEESAQSLGVEVEKLKKILLVVGSLLTGSAVAVGGLIGFIGLIVPHIVRLLVGSDHRILIPSSALVGAIFLILTDTLARTVIAPTEIPVGIITALFGAPFFLYLLKTKKTI
ncbi:FecCD family ABC transporter permease [Orenia marismortui]|uniref:FecCD family ABC transporter permease n=1 Tax=Orenia marismortui TaxID=46469 RepID=UPI00035E43E7|nr:iron chelate uptake ABC transporter family permease subunit [Orenia marismortui]